MGLGPIQEPPPHVQVVCVAAISPAAQPAMPGLGAGCRCLCSSIPGYSTPSPSTSPIHKLYQITPDYCPCTRTTTLALSHTLRCLPTQGPWKAMQDHNGKQSMSNTIGSHALCERHPIRPM